jgi:hypothetical protein
MIGKPLLGNLESGRRATKLKAHLPVSQQGAPMKTTGTILVWLGILGLVVSFAMDTTVETNSGFGRVHNLGLMEERRNYILVASLVIVAGVLFYGFGVLAENQANATKTQLGPRCPKCNGLLEGTPELCKHCRAELRWIEGRPFTPEEATLRLKREAERQRLLKADALRRRDEVLREEAMRRKRRQAQLTAVKNRCQSVLAAVLSSPARFDTRLKGVLGEENAILYRFVQALVYLVFPLAVSAAIVTILVFNNQQPTAVAKRAADAPTADSQRVATAQKVKIPDGSIVAGHHAAEAAEARPIQRETSNENRQPSDAPEASVQTRPPVSFPQQIEHPAQLETAKPESAAEPESTKPVGAAASPQGEKTPSSQSFLNDFLPRLNSQIAKVALEDTSSKRDEAHRKMMKVFDEQLKSRTLTLRFPIEDVAKGKTPSDFALALGPPAEAVGADGFRAAFKYYSVHLTPDEARTLKRGDVLVLKGTGRFGSGSAVEAQVKGTLLVLRLSSSVSGNHYGVFLQNPTHNIEHGKNQ